MNGQAKPFNLDSIYSVQVLISQGDSDSKPNIPRGKNRFKARISFRKRVKFVSSTCFWKWKIDKELTYLKLYEYYIYCNCLMYNAIVLTAEGTRHQAYMVGMKQVERDIMPLELLNWKEQYWGTVYAKFDTACSIICLKNPFNGLSRSLFIYTGGKYLYMLFLRALISTPL